MMINQFLSRASSLDRDDELRRFREEFYIPLGDDQEPEIYFVGNSLGLQPKLTSIYVEEELEKWRTLGVRGHFESDFPWMPYHEFLSPGMARLVGAYTDEVVVMNSLTTNLHLMMASFYRPRGPRNKILIEGGAFPSDWIAVTSHVRFHGLDPRNCVIQVQPDETTGLIDHSRLCETIRTHRNELALILLPGVQYYTGQLFDMESLARLANEMEIAIGFDLAHAVGNVPLQLHDWNIDFAVWCTYKYLNSGPGSVGGCFIHRRHAADTDMPRLAGWWGHDKSTRFLMKNEFHAIATAEGWQLSNPPILSLAAIRASLDVFDAAGGIGELRKKSVELTQFLYDGLTQHFENQINILTPNDASWRGCQLSLVVDFGATQGREIYEALEAANVRVDWREPDVIRVAPVPLYNSYADVAKFIQILRHIESTSTK
ncbi:MAG TPA: kynureninase [Pirellulaceae bacterium]|nr:kynureninase [Pirellulaceae bacterium]HMO91783.1 kynureninase [Pirellulaceae bacterium]HMP69582.1 kynureninase [Pirellulaceae bacterium]